MQEQKRPRILALYYTQSGQLREILESILSGIAHEVDIVWHRIEPVEEFPFPWPTLRFFDTMPETVQGVTIPVKPLPSHIIHGAYDLVLLGHQPWFLHPSLPIQSFLKSSDAALLRNKKVITVIGARNMWLHAQEWVKAQLQEIGAELIGNIALVDKNPNLISTLTIIRWAFGGKKERSRWLPPAGVQDEDIRRAALFAPILLDATKKSGDAFTTHRALQIQGAVEVKPGLIVLERRGLKAFRKWAAYIRARGGPLAPQRLGRVRLFKNLLIVAIFIFGPLSSLNATIQKVLQRRKLNADAAYFRGVTFESGRLG